MADYFTGNFPVGGYSAIHKGDQFKSQPWSPNFEISEGMRFGLNFPAAYLPFVRYEVTFQDYVVIAGGKPVALTSEGDLVPAGFRKLLAMKAATPGSSFGPQYTQLDQDQRLLKADGTPVVAGEYVIDAMYAAGITVGRCAGVASYDVYARSGIDPTNPATYRFHNYNRQTGIAILTDYLLEYPIEPLKRTAKVLSSTIAAATSEYSLTVNTALSHTIEVKVNGRRDIDWTFVNGTPDKITWVPANYLKIGDVVEVKFKYEESYYETPFKGIATFRGSAKPGDFITVDENSCFVTYSPVVVGDTSAADESASIMSAIDASLDIIGQVYLVDKNFPKQFLDRVKTAYDDRLNGPMFDGRTGLPITLDKQPGSATDGMPANIYLAGGDKFTGIVRFNMNIR